MKLQYACSVLELTKSASQAEDSEYTYLEGMATTPSPDRVGDIVEVDGAKFALPLPLLWQHDSHEPIGEVYEAKPSKKGIAIKARIPKNVTDDIDNVIKKLKAKLIRGLSIGFRGLETVFMKDTGGIRFVKWEWLELSLVTVPMNAEATLSRIKSIDRAARGAIANKMQLDSNSTPGASGSTSSKGTKMNLKEQLAAFEAKRAANVARMQELLQKSADDGSTLDDADSEEYDTLSDEVQKIDKHLKRLRQQQSFVAISAGTSVVSEAHGFEPEDSGTTTKGVRMQTENGANNGNGGVLFVRRELPKGTGFTRFALALAHAKGNMMQALEISKRWKQSTPEVEMVLRAAVEAGTTSDPAWAGSLVQYNDMASEFQELLRPMTILGRMNAVRRVPFNIRMIRQTAGTMGTFVGEGKPKPVKKLAFDTVTLPWAKAATIVVMTEELVRLSNPNAENVARQDLLDGIAQYLDMRFIDPSIAGVSGVSPAAITYGITPIGSTGSTLAAITADAEAAMRAMVAADIPISSCVWVMNPVTALAISMLRNNQDNFAFPTVNINGGTWFGLPVITSNSVTTGGSPDTSYIALVCQNEVFLADDGVTTLDMSTQASVQMSDSPSDGAQELVSLWQNNLIGLRAERWIHWQRRRDAGVAIIDDVAY